MDGKGRVSLPSGFRRVLDAQGGSDVLYLLPRAERSEAHTVYSEAGYEQLLDEFYDQYPEDHPDHDRAAALYVNGAVQLPVDPAGRFVLPREHRDALALGDEVTFVGYANRFQLWEPVTRATFDRDARATTGGAPRIRMGKVRS